MHSRGMGWLVMVTLVLLGFTCAEAGQQRRGMEEEDETLASMSIEELRAYQGYFYAIGGRDPMMMRLPTAIEMGGGARKAKQQAPTREEQEMSLNFWLREIKQAIVKQDYDSATKVAVNAMHVIDNEWPPIKPEYMHMIKMSDDIRNYHRMAARLKNQQDIAKEFKSFRIKIDGIAWSPTDSKAVINGKAYSSGEVLQAVRKQGDLRIEVIEETGVVFQFKGVRFRLPVTIFSQLSPPEDGN